MNIGDEQINRFAYFYAMDNDLKPDKQPQSFQSPANWTGHQTDLVEFIYTVHGTNAINNGQAKISEVSELFEQAFNFKLKADIYPKYAEIKKRKTNPVKFMDYLKTGYW